MKLLFHILTFLVIYFLGNPFQTKENAENEDSKQTIKQAERNTVCVWAGSRKGPTMRSGEPEREVLSCVRSRERPTLATPCERAVTVRKAGGGDKVLHLQADEYAAATFDESCMSLNRVCDLDGFLD